MWKKFFLRYLGYSDWQTVFFVEFPVISSIIWAGLEVRKNFFSARYKKCKVWFFQIFGSKKKNFAKFFIAFNCILNAESDDARKKILKKFQNSVDISRKPNLKIGPIFRRCQNFSPYSSLQNRIPLRRGFLTQLKLAF